MRHIWFQIISLIIYFNHSAEERAGEIGGVQVHNEAGRLRLDAELLHNGYEQQGFQAKLRRQRQSHNRVKHFCLYFSIGAFYE